MGNAVLSIVLPSAADIETQRKHLAHGALFVPEPQPPPEPFAEVVLRVVAGSNGEEVDLAGRVLQILPGRGIAVAFDDLAAARGKLDALFARAEGATESSGPSRVFWGRSEPQVQAPPSKEADPTELHAQIATMTTAQKIQLALHGDRTARQLLVKDLNKNLQGFLLQNPRITLEEVRYLAGYRQASPEVLATIGAHRDYTQNPTIVAALVGNPRTPSTVALKLVDRLPISELRRLAKSGDVPRAVAMAARKRVTE